MNTTRASLLLRVRDRSDAAAWREFDAIYRPLLHRFAQARGLYDNEADDVVQHCMGAIVDRIGSFDYDPTRGRFKAWLRTIVNNHVRNLLRVRRPDRLDDATLRGTPDAQPTPEDEFDRMWMQEHLRYCLCLVRDNVDASTYRAFQDYVLDERPVEEVCRRTGMNRDQLYSVKWRVTRKLRELFQERVGDDE